MKKICLNCPWALDEVMKLGFSWVGSSIAPYANRDNIGIIMSKQYRNHITKSLLQAKKNDHHHSIAIIELAKSNYPASEFKEIISSLKKTRPETESFLKNQDRKTFKELLWLGCGKSTSLERQLKFATLWFSDCTIIINDFLQQSNSIEQLTLSGNLVQAMTELDNFHEAYGWSIWLSELKFALLAAIGDKDKEENEYKALCENSRERIANLFANILKERNDESTSIESFISKWSKNISSLPESNPNRYYFLYRNFGHISNAEQTFSTVINFEFKNSIFDYYESVIDALVYISTQETTDTITQSALACSNALQSYGIKDFRLNKVNALLGEANYKYQHADTCPEAQVIENAINLITIEENHQSAITDKILKYIHGIHKYGLSAELELSRLLKFGINFRGLKIGSTLGNFAGNSNFDLSNGAVLPQGLQFSSPELTINNLLGLPYQLSEIIIAREAESPTSFGNLPEFIDIKNPSNINLESIKPTFLNLWLCRRIADMGSTAEAIKIADKIASFGTPWKRHAQKIKILSSIKSNNIDDALKYACSSLSENNKYGYELPLHSVFKSRKWRDLKYTDCIQLGIVSHFTYICTENHDARYFCRMACREFSTRNIKYDIQKNWALFENNRQREIILFLHHVWNDENLSIAGFESTQELRSERISTLQLLLQLDTDNENIYTQEIRELTFNETLWKGVQQINETRIFVNEPAIARWAEKDLSNEFNTWKSLSDNTSEKTSEIDEIFIEYLISGDMKTLSDNIKKGVNKSDNALLGVFNRLLSRFLSDPADGLNCYLSCRIRHGSLKGTLLGPLEEAGIIGITENDLLTDRRLNSSDISPSQKEQIKNLLLSFNTRLANLANEIIKEKVQIKDSNHPKGIIWASINPELGVIKALATHATFQQFTYTCFDIFWEALKPSLEEAANYFSQTVKGEIQREFDALIDQIRSITFNATALTTSLRTTATATQTQCDQIANWFDGYKHANQLDFGIKEAIEISKRVTKNVYRLFPVDFVATAPCTEVIPLTSFGLLAITDALYIILENSWKHSGLGANLQHIIITPKLDTSNNILLLTVENKLSESRARELINGGLASIREKIAGVDIIDNAQAEGGSGLAKLSRLTRTINRDAYEIPLDINIVNSQYWHISVCIPIYRRGEAYDAYFEG